MYIIQHFQDNHIHRKHRKIIEKLLNIYFANSCFLKNLLYCLLNFKLIINYVLKKTYQNIKKLKYSSMHSSNTSK